MRHTNHSSNREKLLEHLFIGEVHRYLWQAKINDAESLSPDVDSSGYDIVLTCNDIFRHIQLKSSYRGAKTARQTVNLALTKKPSGCVIWMIFDRSTLELGPFLWFGNAPGKPLGDLSNYTTTKHSRANAKGYKAERPNHRVIPKGHFEVVQTIPKLVEKLFGIACEDVSCGG